MSANKERRLAIVTGAAGFLGRYIAAELKTRGWQVLGVDRQEVEGGVCLSLPTPEFATFLSRVQPAALVHAAGPASVAASLLEPLTDWRGSVLTFAEVLEAVRQHAPTCRVALISSAAVYGNPQKLPISETAPLKPISPYGYHKLMCEQLGAEYSQIYELRVAAARVFSAYGPGLRRQVLWDICQRILAGGEIRLDGTGLETRDFVHAQDVAQGIASIIEHGHLEGEAYNLATGIQTTIQALGEMLMDRRRVADTRLSFSGVTRPGDPLYWQADISRLTSLGYLPRVKLADGVQSYFQWMSNLPKTAL